MEWLSMGLGFLITLSYSLIFEMDGLKNYITPNKTVECSDDWSTCLTLQEYASQPDKYFINDTIFYFVPGSHLLDISLNFTNVHNFTFQGLLGSEMVNVFLGPLVSITWEDCSNIEISSIVFLLLENFTFSIVFGHSYHVQLSNISVLGNEYIGYSSIISRHSTLSIQNSKFAGIQGSFGAALMILRSCVIFTGKNIFLDNSASFGGSLYIFESGVTLSGTNTFMNNNSTNRVLDHHNIKIYLKDDDDWMRGSGGAIYCKSSTLIINTEYSIFVNNSAQGSGGAIAALDGNITIIGSIMFIKNAAEYVGGAISLLTTILLVSGNISFINNKAYVGGALSISGAKLLLVVNEEQLLNDAMKFCWNVAMSGGMASIAAEYVGVLESSYRNYDESVKGVAVFCGNVASWNGGAIRSVYSSDIMVDGNIFFESNRATFGGAMHLGSNSKLILSSSSSTQTSISFVLNLAHKFGGALYIEDFQCSTWSFTAECFLSIYSYYHTARNISLFFLNNSAEFIGSTLYGGQLNECRLYYITNYNTNKCGNRACDYYSDKALGIFMNMSTIIQYNESGLATNISSQAKWIKHCHGENSMDTNDTLRISIIPGEEFSIQVVALDQTGSPVPTKLFSENSLHSSDDYRISPSSQYIHNLSCNNIISFQLYSKHKHVHGYFTLYPDNSCQNLARHTGLELDIYILPCPLGFELSKDHQWQCYCNNKLLKFTQKCYMRKSTAIIERVRNNFWISQVNNGPLIIHESRCPLDYCKDTVTDVTLSDPSVQCDFNRTGTLCGQCRKNFSLALGSLHCAPCDDKYIALLLIFATAGLTILALVFLLHLTVAVGTLNGLIFYANIIQANHQAFFPRDKISIFTIFSSWINLDLGIETCFYDGMDIYAYSWFQYLFPFYVWFLIGLIILASRYFQSIAKQLGQNPVAVLATVFLISYSKILQAIIVPLSFTYLTYYNNSESHQIIWLYDGSIDYFKEPKHIALGLFATLSLVVFVLPYISLLLFGHWLQGCSNWWILSWLNKLKPFMDAYYAPYKKHTRYWTGLLLLSRLGLILIFAINANGSESVNLLAVSSVTIALLAIKLLRVYENLYKDILESSFILNLGIFSVATFYLKEESKDDDSQLILSSISVGIALITFIGILLFHISVALKSSRFWKVHMLPFIQKSLLLSKILRITPVTKDKNIKGDKDTVELQALPTSTEIDVDLREPLLDITESQAAA